MHTFATDVCISVLWWAFRGVKTFIWNVFYPMNVLTIITLMFMKRVEESDVRTPSA